MQFPSLFLYIFSSWHIEHIFFNNIFPFKQSLEQTPLSIFDILLLFSLFNSQEE